jgi:hypothetical protein
MSIQDEISNSGESRDRKIKARVDEQRKVTEPRWVRVKPKKFENRKTEDGSRGRVERKGEE